MFTRTATITLAAAALTAPNALARPIDTGAPQTHTQALRSPDASDAATRPDSATPPLPGPPTWPRHPKPITTPTTASDNGENTTTIGLGIAVSLLAAAGIAGIAHRSRRTRRQRVTA
jgi:hypothetical protein